MPFMTADLCDEYYSDTDPDNQNDIQVVGSCLNNYGGRPKIHGEIVTLKLFEDNQLVRDQVNSSGLDKNGNGKVLVVDAGASMRRAVLGDMLAAKAAENGWNGVIINGCIRDSVEMSTMKLGVKALGTHPLKTVKNGVGETNVHVNFLGLNIKAGHYIYADEDGIIVASKALI